MKKELRKKLEQNLAEVTEHLEKELIPFWLKRGIDREYGGYLVCFDENGELREDTDKMIVTQTRMIWGFSHFYRIYRKQEFLEAAEQGVRFFVRHFWDEEKGGWFWKVSRDGTLLDDGKVVYGQTFAIYALSEYTLASGNQIGLTYASKTFDLLQKYCTDTVHGGYYENMERDWRRSPGGNAAGDRKSLDIHMHMMEAYTTLYECSQEEIHGRKLKECMDLILEKMVDQEAGCGRNQFDSDFCSIPAININRTWNAERETGEVIEKPVDTTSYGHNIELIWLLNRAADILGLPRDTYRKVDEKLAEHTLEYGFDYELGGVFRDGPHRGKPLVKDKEWWQNCEVLIGFLDCLERLGDEKFAELYLKEWEFDDKYMINHSTGEWKQLLTADGRERISNMGNQWKCIYHTGRAISECKERLTRILQNENR